MRVKGESPNVPIILVGNKADLDHARQVNALLNRIYIHCGPYHMTKPYDMVYIIWPISYNTFQMHQILPFLDCTLLNSGQMTMATTHSTSFFHFRFLKRKFRHSHQNGILNTSKQVPRQEWMLIKSFMIWWKKYTSKRKRLPQNRFQQNRSRIVVWKNLFRLFGNICKEIAENELLMTCDSWIMSHVVCKNALLYLP